MRPRHRTPKRYLGISAAVFSREGWGYARIGGPEAKSRLLDQSVVNRALVDFNTGRCAHIKTVSNDDRRRGTGVPLDPTATKVEVVIIPTPSCWRTASAPTAALQRGNHILSGRVNLGKRWCVPGRICLELMGS